MGGVVRTLTGKPMSGEKPDRANYGNPYAEELMARVLGSIDQYLDKRGVRKYVPQENFPYEWRGDADRAAIRGREQQDAKDDQRPARRLAINEPDTNDEDPTREKDSAEMVKEQKQLSQQPQNEISDPSQEEDPLMARRKKIASFLSSQPKQSFLSQNSSLRRM